MPGDRISLDQYESSVKGRLSHTRGQEPSHQQFSGGTIFVYHATGLIQAFHQISFSASDTIMSKQKFEQVLLEHNVEIVKYHSDNGVFTSSQFTSILQQQHQHIRLSGVGAHHQNGIAERFIQTVVWYARSMLVHCHLHWHSSFEANLWPFAMDYATWIYNHTLSTSGFAPIELLTGTRMNCHHLGRVRVWGCPSFVLDPRLQDGHKIPKWEPRARQGQFLLIKVHCLIQQNYVGIKDISVIACRLFY
jgi:calcineurin-like phosphoesterase family protein